MELISFEGSIGAGKTSLTNYLSYDLGKDKLLEKYDVNPFLEEFYKGTNVNLETEISFLLIHYSQLKDIEKTRNDIVLCDFSIEKDMVYAKLNLNNEELKIFENVYEYVVKEVGIPYATIYLDLSLDTIRKRIFQRGRSYELNTDPTYFKEYNDKVKNYFERYAKSKVYLYKVDDLDYEQDNEKVIEIKNKILEVI